MIITQTPFRMSFFGGGTDMESFFRENGGSVLSTTFDKYCYVNVRHLPRFFDYSTELSYSKTERVTNIDAIQHPAIRNAMKMLDMHEIRLTYEADLPARSGLGTSSSFAVGMLNAFYALKGKYADKKKLADEAINTIVQKMENHRDDVVVILAGYPDKMEGLLQKNPGLRSRIAYHVPFNDYDTAALCEIAKLIAKQKGLTFTDEACNKLTVLFDAARNESDFGNGRYVRNVIEIAKMAQASRLLTMDFDSIESEDIALITADDIEIPKSSAKTEKKQIGFST